MSMLDYMEIFKTFNNNGIHYIIVGGIAVNLYGIPRMTYDIDILLYLEETNTKRFVEQMIQWDFKPKIPVKPMDIIDVNKRSDCIKNKSMKAFCLANPDWAISKIDIIIDSPINYEEAITRAKFVTINGIKLPIISIDDLITMKQVSMRDQDIVI
jgi:predicted nucleotidyltransferase